MTYTYRGLNDDDTYKLIEIGKKLNTYIGNQGGEAYEGVFYNNRLVGGTTVLITALSIEFNIVIMKKHQGKGLSKRLINGVESLAREIGKSTVEATVINKQLMAYLLSNGYERMNEQSSFVWKEIR